MTPDVLREKFNTGLTFAEFQRQAESNKAILEELYNFFSELSPDTIETFAQDVAQRGGAIHVLALAEDWCGDAVRAFPLLARLEESVGGLSVRIQKSDLPENKALVGNWPKGERNPIPIIVFMDADFNEIGHWVERTAAGNALRAKLEAEHKGLEKREFFKVAGPITFTAFKESHWKDTLAEWSNVLRVKQPQTA